MLAVRGSRGTVFSSGEPGGKVRHLWPGTRAAGVVRGHYPAGRWRSVTVWLEEMLTTAGSSRCGQIGETRPAPGSACQRRHAASATAGAARAVDSDKAKAVRAKTVRAKTVRADASGGAVSGEGAWAVSPLCDAVLRCRRCRCGGGCRRRRGGVSMSVVTRRLACSSLQEVVGPGVTSPAAAEPAGERLPIRLQRAPGLEEAGIVAGHTHRRRWQSPCASPSPRSCVGGGRGRWPAARCARGRHRRGCLAAASAPSARAWGRDPLPLAFHARQDRLGVLRRQVGAADPHIVDGDAEIVHLDRST